MINYKIEVISPNIEYYRYNNFWIYDTIIYNTRYHNNGSNWLRFGISLKRNFLDAEL